VIMSVSTFGLAAILVIMSVSTFRLAAILVIMSVSTFKSDVILYVFIISIIYILYNMYPKDIHKNVYLVLFVYYYNK